MTDLPLVFVWGLKVAPLLLAAWAATALLHRASAATRHFVWVLAISSALALPVVATVVPRWEVAVLAPSPNELATEGDPGRSEAIEGDQERSEALRSITVDRREAPSIAFDGPRSPAIAFDRLRSPSIAFAIWASGAGLIVLLIALSLWRTHRLARCARPMADAGVIAEARRLARRLDLTRPVALLQAADEAMPMTWGGVHPRVLLPAGFPSWPAARRQAVLIHELAHIRRLDWLTQLVARFACALYWWNPLLWIAARRLREERELACDDLVLAHGTVPSSYAGDLLEIARAFRPSPATALAGVAMARRSQLAGRLLAVLDATRRRGGIGIRSAVATAAAVTAVLIPVAALAAGTAGDSSDDPPAQQVPSHQTSVTAASDVPSFHRSVASATSAASAVSVEPAGPPARRPAQQARATLCDWSARAGRSNSSASSIDDDRMTIKIARDDCTLTVESDGKVTFRDDDRDVERISQDGYFEIEERIRGRERRRVEIMSEGGSLRRRWFVNGDERPYGDEAQAWLGDIVLVLMRRAGFNAQARAVRIFEQRGTEGLMAEIDELHSDYVRAEYYSVLFARAQLTVAQQARLLDGAARHIQSDYELSRVMKALAARGPLDASVQRAYVQASESLESDYEHRQALDALVKAGDLDVTALDAMLVSARRLRSDYERAELLVATAARYPAGRRLPASYVTAVSDMKSDYERRRVLDPLLARNRLSPADRERVLAVLLNMRSDYERAQALLGVIQGGPLDEASRVPFFRAVDGMSSDHERQRVLDAVVATRPDEATTLAVLASVAALDSDYSKAEVLVAVARRGLETDRLRQAYQSTADGIRSSYERDRARRAAGLREM